VESEQACPYAHVGRTTSNIEYDMLMNMELYHVINRGVDGRKIFMDTQDYARFVHDLYEFNDTVPALQYSRIVGRTASNIREQLVDIHGWALMRNHIHLLLSERMEGGLTLFLRKLTGYARYFNERHERKGLLLQGTKKVLVEHHKHFLYILHYVHLNPLDYLHGTEGWRERDKGNIHNLDEALAYLKKYRWSSYLDYCEQRNFPSLLSTKLFKDMRTDYEKEFKAYLSDRVELEFDMEAFE
jgi:REP element-mobilizing transposase RayT